MHSVKHILIGFLLIPTGASAADYGTYRAGNSYMSMPAQSADQCISYCNGDAQCKGWNFVKINPRQTICEFNAKAVSPIASAISISGNSSVQGTAYSHQITRPVIQTNGSVTRVGQANIAQAPFNQTSLNQNTQARKIRREAPPKIDPRHQIANYRSRLHGVKTPTGQTHVRTPQPSQRIQKTQRRFIPQLDALPGRATNIQVPDQRPGPQSFQRPPANNAPLTPTHVPNSAPSTQAPTKTEPPIVQAEDLNAIPRLSEMPENQPRLSLNAALAGGPVAGNLPSTSSLYGSLYDDVRQPKTLSAKDIPMDPDAPISTVTSVPIETIDVTTF